MDRIHLLKNLGEVLTEALKQYRREPWALSLQSGTARAMAQYPIEVNRSSDDPAPSTFGSETGLQ